MFKQILLSLTAVFALLPGVGVLLTGLGTPPGHKVVFGALVEGFGVLALLILLVNRRKLQGVNPKKITRWAIGFGIAALVCLIMYVVVIVPKTLLRSNRFPAWAEEGNVYFPLWLNGNAAVVVNDSGGRQSALDEFGPAEIQALLASMPGGDWLYMITTLVYLLLFLGFFTLLTLAFGIAGFHLADRHNDD